jgi:ubiquinone/menaquinone biosynthesis C-methylase UbiE
MNLPGRAMARLYDPVMRGTEQAGLAAKRRELLAGLAGHVVEIGAGTGANLPYMTASVDRLTLLEPSPPMARRLRARVTDVGTPPGTSATAAIDIEVLEAPAEALPLPDASADAVVSTLVLCSVDDLGRSLAELRRILRPGGRLVLIEHVAADGSLGTVQRVIAPAWQVVTRGCRPSRKTGAAVADAGFDVTDLRPWRLPGGGIAGPAITGVARRP